MKPAPFDYIRPRDVTEALNALAGQGSVKLIAGAQSLGPMLNLRLVRVGLLVDVARIEELRVVEDLGDRWRIGASVTHARLEDAHGKLDGLNPITRVAGGIAYRAIRNKGTMGGSLAHADPAADWPLVLAAAGATVHVRGKDRRRVVPADMFLRGAFTVDLVADELIEYIEVPKLTSSARFGYYKFCRKTGEFPEASAAVVFDPDRQVARVFVGALDGPPRSLPALAASVARKGSTGIVENDIAAALAAAAPHIEPLRRRMHAACIGRAVKEALQ